MTDVLHTFSHFYSPNNHINRQAFEFFMVLNLMLLLLPQETNENEEMKLW